MNRLPLKGIFNSFEKNNFVKHSRIQNVIQLIKKFPHCGNIKILPQMSQKWYQYVPPQRRKMKRIMKSIGQKITRLGEHMFPNNREAGKVRVLAGYKVLLFYTRWIAYRSFWRMDIENVHSFFLLSCVGCWAPHWC